MGQLRTGFYCRFIAAFLPSSLARVLRACSPPRAVLSAGEGAVGARSDTVCGPLGVSVFNDGRDKVAGPPGPSVCLEIQEAPSVGHSDPVEGCG